MGHESFDGNALCLWGNLTLTYDERCKLLLKVEICALSERCEILLNGRNSHRANAPHSSA